MVQKKYKKIELCTFCNLCNASIQFLLGIEHPGHEPHLLGLHGGDLATGEREVGGVPVPNDPRKPLQRAEVGDDGHVHLPEHKRGVLGAAPYVAGGHDLDAAADAGAVHRRDHRLPAPLDGREGRLHLQDGAAEPLAAGAGSPEGPWRAPGSRARCRRRSAGRRRRARRRARRGAVEERHGARDLREGVRAEGVEPGGAVEADLVDRGGRVGPRHGERLEPAPELRLGEPRSPSPSPPPAMAWGSETTRSI